MVSSSGREREGVRVPKQNDPADIGEDQKLALNNKTCTGVFFSFLPLFLCLSLCLLVVVELDAARRTNVLFLLFTTTVASPKSARLK